MILAKDRNANFIVEQAMAYLDEIEADGHLTATCEQIEKINAFFVLVTYEGSGFDQDVIDALRSIKTKADLLLKNRYSETPAH